MDYSEPKISVNIPEEAVDECYDFYDKLKKEFVKQKDTESLRMKLNYMVRDFDVLLKMKYRNYDGLEGFEVGCKVVGEWAYHFAIWSVEEICDVYREYYPERFVDKDEYTRIEVNNMLFELEIRDIINGYECIALPYSFAEKHNNEVFDGMVRVKCRYL